MDTRNRQIQTDIYTSEQIKRVLNGSGIEVVNEVDSDFIVFCPYHNNTRTPAAEVSKKSGIFFCFSCQISKSLTEFVMYVSNRSYFEASRYIKSKEQESNLATLINQTLYKKPDYVEYDKELVKRLNNQAMQSSRAISYFTNRKITKESIINFELGYSEKQDMVTIPVQSPDGMCVGFVGRSVDGKEFKNTPGLPKSKILFNLHRIKKLDHVYVVESSFDAIRLNQVGLPAVATLGANVSKIQTDLLQKYFNNIVVILDNDEAGQSMGQKIIDRLGSRVFVIKLDDKYKDIGDMDDDEIKNLEFRFDKTILSMLN